MYQQDGFICMRPASSRAAESNSCASFENEGLRKAHFMIREILTGGLQDILGQGAANASPEIKTGPVLLIRIMQEDRELMEQKMQVVGGG